MPNGKAEVYKIDFVKTTSFRHVEMETWPADTATDFFVSGISSISRTKDAKRTNTRCCDFIADLYIFFASATSFIRYMVLYDANLR